VRHLSYPWRATGTEDVEIAIRTSDGADVTVRLTVAWQVEVSREEEGIAEDFSADPVWPPTEIVISDPTTGEGVTFPWGDLWPAHQAEIKAGVTSYLADWRPRGWEAFDAPPEPDKGEG
jgi:hypothetical protein